MIFCVILLESSIMHEVSVIVIRPGWVFNPLIRRGWQHDGRNPYDPEDPPIKPQKIPG